MRQPCEKRLLAATGMMESLHREELPLDSVMRLIQQRAGRRHLRVCKHDIPARLLRLKPAPDALPIGHPCVLRHVIRKVAEPLTEGKHAQALALSHPREQGVAPRAE